MVLWFTCRKWGFVIASPYMHQFVVLVCPNACSVHLLNPLLPFGAIWLYFSKFTQFWRGGAIRAEIWNRPAILASSNSHFCCLQQRPNRWYSQKIISIPVGFPWLFHLFLGQPTTSNAPHSPPPRACSPLAHPNPWSSGQSLPRLADLKSSCGWNQNHAVNVDLVGGLNPSENMKVNWDDYSQYMGK